MLKMGDTGEEGKDFQAEITEHANTGKDGAAYIRLSRYRLRDQKGVHLDFNSKRQGHDWMVLSNKG